MDSGLLSTILYQIVLDAYNLGARIDADDPELKYIYTIAYGYSVSDKIEPM
jgi:hypothetical protein